MTDIEKLRAFAKEIILAIELDENAHHINYLKIAVKHGLYVEIFEGQYHWVESRVLTGNETDPVENVKR